MHINMLALNMVWVMVFKIQDVFCDCELVTFVLFRDWLLNRKTS